MACLPTWQQTHFHLFTVMVSLFHSPEKKFNVKYDVVIENEQNMSLLAVAQTPNASQYVEILRITSDVKARWKTSLIEQLVPKNILWENTSYHA